jgi:hypothetical protein
MKITVMKSTVGCAGAFLGLAIAPLASAAARHHVTTVTTISYAPNSYVIGNAYPGWTDDMQGPVQFSSGPGNPKGTDYRWGFLYGEGFDRCAWINMGEVSGDVGARPDECGSPQEIDTPMFLATYTNGMHNDLAGDGSFTRMNYAGSGCTDRHGYGNVDPWKVPAIPANVAGTVADGKVLLWRYVSRDGKWVMVRDPVAAAGGPNWYFVHRGCVSLENRR